MSAIHNILVSKLFAVVICLLLSATTFGQQVNVSTPFVGASDSFFERMGVNFGFSIPGGQGPGSRIVGFNGFGPTANINFSQGGFGEAIPAIGGFTPNSGATFGFGRRSSNGGGFSLGFQLAKGNSRLLNATTPSVTIPNGGIGTVSNGAIVPFVTGVIPVVGATPVIPIDNAVTRGIASGQLRPYSQRRLEESRSNSLSNVTPIASSEISSATVADVSVAEIKAQKALAKANRKKQLDAAIQTARTAHDKKDYRTARIELRKAIKLAEDNSQLRELKNWMKTPSRKMICEFHEMTKLPTRLAIHR